MACSSKYKHLIGHKVFVTLLQSKQTFEGHFHTINERRSSVILRQVATVPSDGRRFEQLELTLREIQNISSLPESLANSNQSSKQNDVEVKSEERSLITQKFASFFNDVFYNKLKIKVQDCVYLKEINKDFNEALQKIRKFKMIAVSGVGSDEGRFGLMSILGVATREEIFLFDIINLGERGFMACGTALKWILESRDVLKVVHNCRLLSDNLFHKYNVKLSNVFDTQVLYSTIIKNQSGSFPSTAISLSSLLSLFFHLPEDFCKEATSLEKWRRRPLAAELVDIAGWRVSFLLPLKSALENALYAPFDNWCNVYTNVVRDCDTLEARSSLERNMLLPKEITDCKTDDFKLVKEV